VASFTLKGDVESAVIPAAVADVKLFADLPFNYLFHKVPSFRDNPTGDTGDSIKVPYRKEPSQSRRPGKNGGQYDTFRQKKRFPGRVGRIIYLRTGEN
jgi:hypothetical protein